MSIFRKRGSAMVETADQPPDLLGELREEARRQNARLMEKIGELSEVEKEIKRVGWNVNALHDEQRVTMIHATLQHLSERRGILVEEIEGIREEAKRTARRIDEETRRAGKAAAAAGEPEIRAALADLVGKIQAAIDANDAYYELRRSFGEFPGNWPYSCPQLKVYALKPWLSGVEKFLGKR